MARIISARCGLDLGTTMLPVEVVFARQAKPLPGTGNSCRAAA